jgi:hypothetical protein
MDCYDVGDIATFTLTVDPAAGDTTATVAITDPAGATVAATPSPNSSKSRWTANATLTSAGIWEATWTVTGTGAGAETVQILVRPTPSTLPGRSYATTGDLAGYLDCGDLPAHAGRRLVRATELIDQTLIGARYPVDAAGMPTDQVVADALKWAVCAQVEWWAATGDPDGVGTAEQWDQVQIGSVKLGRSSGGSTGKSAPVPELAPAALRKLQLAGLLPARPLAYG